MTTNAHTHCPTCIATAREMMREGMAEVIADDTDLDWDAAVAAVDADALEEQTIEYLDGLIAMQDDPRVVKASTCVFVHND
jgi:hypothetical protein